MDLKKTRLFSLPIAHRGLYDQDVPENSIAAFERAAEAGFPIELDVRTIDDGSVVVFHDDRLARMTGLDGYVSNLSKGELSDIRLKGSDQKIPLFAEVLEAVGGRVPILIEIKNEAKVGALEGSTLELLHSYKGEYAVESFNPYSLEYFKHNAPQIPRGQLSCFFRDADIGRFKRYYLKRLKMNRVSSPDFIAYDFSNLPNKYVTRTKLPVVAWTIRSNADMEKVLPYCDNIIFENFIPVLAPTPPDNNQ